MECTEFQRWRGSKTLFGLGGKAQAAQGTGGTWSSVPVASTPSALGFKDCDFRMVRILAKKYLHC